MEIKKGKLWNVIFVIMTLLVTLSLFAVFIHYFTLEPEHCVRLKNTEDTIGKHQEFEVVGIIPGTKNCVESSGDAGGKLYVCITNLGDVCKIEIGSDGSQNLFADSHDGYKQEINRSSNGVLNEKRTHALGRVGIFLDVQHFVFEEKCLQYLKELPRETQKAVLQTLLSLKT